MPLLPKDIAHDMDGAIVALGVVEYVCDVKAFLQGLLAYRRTLIISYAPADQHIREGTSLGVRSNGLTLEEWEDVLSDVGLGKTPFRQARVIAGDVINHMYWYKPLGVPTLAPDSIVADSSSMQSAPDQPSLEPPPPPPPADIEMGIAETTLPKTHMRKAGFRGGPSIGAAGSPQAQAKASR